MRCRTGGSIRNRNTAGTCNSYRLPAKTYKPIASVAALTSQPLAALPPYGCGVPFTGSERHGGLQVVGHFRRTRRRSGLSFCGAKRRGNLLQQLTNSPQPSCYSTGYSEIAPQGHFLALRAQGATSAFGLLAMTRQVVPWCTSALLPLNSPVQGAQGAPLHPILRRFPF